jgi:hypothetical protein
MNLFYHCEKCKNKLILENSILNSFSKISDKRIYLKKCSNCNRFYYFTQLNAIVFSKLRELLFKVKLTRNEYYYISKIVSQCKNKYVTSNCSCFAHKKVEKFEQKHNQRKRLLSFKETIF